MTDAMLRRLAETAIWDAEKNCPGEWEEHWDGTLGSTSVMIKLQRGGIPEADIRIRRRDSSIPPEAKWMINARYREPELARAVLRLLDDRDVAAESGSPSVPCRCHSCETMARLLDRVSGGQNDR